MNLAALDLGDLELSSEDDLLSLVLLLDLVGDFDLLDNPS